MNLSEVDFDPFAAQPATASQPTLTPVDNDPFAGSGASAGPKLTAVDEDPFKPSTDRSAGEIAKDLAVNVASGVANQVQTAGNLYGLATGDMNNLAATKGKQASEYFKGLESDQLKAMEAERRDKINAADTQLGKAGTAFWETIKSPSLLTAFLAEQSPSLLPVAAAGRVAGIVSKARGASLAAQEAIATGTAVGTGAVMQGSDSGSQAYDQLMALPDKVWQDNPEYQQILATQVTKDPDAAKRQIAAELAREAAVQSAAASGALNLIPGARILEKQLAGVKGISTSRVGNAAKGFIGESLQEGGEEGAGAIAANVATQKVDPTQETFKGAGEATGMAAAAGLFGAAGGAIETPETHETPDHLADTSKILKASAEGRLLPVGQPADTATASDLESESGPSDAAYIRNNAPEATQDRRKDPIREDRGERQRFQMPDEYADQIHREKVANHNLAPEAAADFAPNIRKNKLGYYADDELMPTLERAQKHREETGEEVYIVFGDIANMGGGNEYYADKGGEVAFDEKFLIPTSHKLVDNIQKKAKDADIVPIRWGGDELIQVVVNATKKQIEQGMQTSVGDIAQMNKEQGLSDIKHKSKPDSPHRGVGLYYGIEGIEPGQKLGDIMKSVARKVALNKLERKGVGKTKAGIPGVNASGGQAGRAEGGAAAPGNRVPTAEASQAAGQERPTGEHGDQRLNYVNPKLKRDKFRLEIQSMASKLVEGGGITLTGGDFSPVNDNVPRGKETPVKRSPSLNPEWFQRMAADPETSMPVAEVKNAVKKAVAGDRLGLRQMRVVEAMLGELTQERTAPDRIKSVKKELELALEQRRMIAKGMSPDKAARIPVEFYDDAGQMFEESEYLPEMTGEARSLFELATMAEQAGFKDQVDAILERNLTDAEAAVQLFKLIENQYGRAEQQNRPAEAEGQPAEKAQASAAEEKGEVDGRSDSAPVEKGTVGKAKPADQPDLSGNAARVQRSLPDDDGKRSTVQRTTDSPPRTERLKDTEAESQTPADAGVSVSAAANEAATSPKNDLPQPTEAQKEAGNYKKGHVTVNGLDISIENPAGSRRRPEWPPLKHHYGYIKGTIGKDKDHIDVFLNNKAADDSRPVFVVDQVNKDGTFDEHKVMLGFADDIAAREGYLANYSKGWKGLGAITQMSWSEFKTWLESGNTKEPVSKLGESKSLLDRHEDTIERMRTGQITLEEYQQAFKDLVKNQAAVTLELAGKTKDELLAAGGGMFAQRYRADKKAKVIDALYEDMLEDFVISTDGGLVSYSMGMGGNYREQHRAAIAAKVEAITQENLDAFATRVKAARDEAAKNHAERVEGLKDPKTLTDYQNLLRLKMADGKTFAAARMELTPDQREQYDLLAAEETRPKREAEKRARKTRVYTSGQKVAGNIIATKHTKKGHDLFVVQLSERVSREDYNALNTSAKKMGGYYSSFRGAGAVPGFQFTERAQAEAFSKLAGGDTEQAQEVINQRRDAFEDNREQSAVERLREMADSLDERADEKLSQDRKQNTSRRAAMAARAEAAANYDKALAKTMRNLAEAIEGGKAKFLDDVRTKAQVEMLNSFLTTAKYDELLAKYPEYSEQEKHKGESPTKETADYAGWPAYSAWRGDLAKLGRQLSEIDGSKLLGQKLLKIADDVTKEYLKFAKDNLDKVAVFTKSDGERAVFAAKGDAEASITGSGHNGKAIVLPYKPRQNIIILSPAEAQKRGIWEGADDQRISLSQDLATEVIQKTNRANRHKGRVEVPWQLESSHDKRTRLAAMGIETPSEFRAALREYVALKELPKAPDKVKELERSMVGRRKDGMDFFPTPEGIADEMVTAADIRDGMTVLEPSAGMGHIADRIRESGAEPDVIELSPERRELLEAKGYNVVGRDFLEFKGGESAKELPPVERLALSNLTKIANNARDAIRKFDPPPGEYQHESRAKATTRHARASAASELWSQKKKDLASKARELLSHGYTIPQESLEAAGSSYEYDENGKYAPIEAPAGKQYDRILMNPPFSDRRDAAHIKHAYSLLKPGGRMVAIAGEGVFFGSDKKANEFRDWLESVGATDEKLEEGVFLDPSLPVNTGVSARMVVIDKSSDEPKFSKESVVPSGKKPIGLNKEFVNQIANDFLAGVSADINVIVHATQKNATGRDTVADKNGKEVRVKSVILGNDVVLIAENLNSRSDVESVLRHEILWHHGFSLFNEQTQKAIEKSVNATRADPKYADTWDHILKHYDDATPSMQAQEFMAKLAETEKGRLTKIYHEVLAMIQAALRKLGLLKGNITQSELQALLNSAERRARQGGESSQLAPAYSKTGISESPFFSALKRAAGNLVQDKGTAGQFLAMLKSQPGVKAEELEWTGLEEYLRAKQEKNLRVTKQEIVDFLEANGVQVETVTKGSGDVTEEDLNWQKFDDYDVYLPAKKYSKVGQIEYLPSNGRYIYQSGGGTRKPYKTLQEAKDAALEVANNIRFDETKFGRYQLPGGENYREVLLTLPRKPGDSAALATAKAEYEAAVNAERDATASGIDVTRRGDITDRTDRAQAALERVRSSEDSGDGQFHSSHFSEPNILAHIRLNDRTDVDGNKVLFVEEIQSDWHQQGRKSGYRDEKRQDELQAELRSFKDDLSDEAQSRRQSIYEEIRNLANAKVPNAPFKSNAWSELAIKRVLRMAAEEGYDAVAWTTGEQQADRYNLAKQVDRVIYSPEAKMLRAYKGRDKVIDRDGVTPEQLPDYIGKEAADRIINNPTRKDPASGGANLHELSGDGLRVGGEGMKGFYDKILPNLFSKVAGRLDKSAKTGTSRVGPGKDAHSIQITDAMRESVMAGQPLFSKTKASSTDTKAFRDWFGDSKVVDENGKPLVVYHGTNADFSEFDMGRGGAVWETSDSEDVMWFADNVGRANAAARDAANVNAETEENYDAQTGANVRPVYLSMQNPKRVGMSDALDPAELADIIKQAKEDGHDGVILSPGEMGGTDYAVFDPSQIKSAIGNRGTFDPNDPNIMFSKTKAEKVEPEFSQENRRLREENKTLWNKAKTYFRRNFMPGGLLPKDVFSEKIQRDNEVQVVEFDINHLVGSLENIVKQEYLKPFEKLDRETMLALNRALIGVPNGTIKPKTMEAITAMRQYIDSLSRDYADILQQQVTELEAEGSPEAAAKAQLMETIVDNIGSYAHRSYRAFDDKDWFKKIPDDVINAARRYLRDQYLESGETPDVADKKAEVAIHEITKNGTAYDSMEAFIRESKLGAKDLTVLKRRKQIAPEIRALLGEYIDPRVNFAKSATKMGRLVWNQRFLERLRDMGTGTFLFSGDDRPPEATVQIAAEGSEVYAPLNGMWTFPEINQAFKDALAKEKMADWYRVMVQLNGMVKYGKTVLSPTTAARNWQSAMFFALANGHFNMAHMTKSIGGLREYFTNGGDAARLEYLRKLKKLGVVYDTPYAGEMMRLLEESRIDDLMQSKTGAPLKAFRSLNKFATKAYQYGDDFWKIIGFENEKASLIDAGMEEDAAEKEAADRIRNTYPTYSLVGRGINWLRRFPLVGTFVSFPAEIIRTQGNILRYIHKDWKEGRKNLAIRRAAGQVFAAGMIYGLAAISKSMVGLDDDEEEAVRLMAAPWERNSNLLFVGRDDGGQLQYIDLSFLDPYNYFKRPITAIFRDQPWEDKLGDVFAETLKPFLGTDIAAGAIGEILANKKETGQPVYNEFATPMEKTVQIANHLRKAIQPGIASNLERTWKAMEGERSPTGRAYDLGDEAFGWAGWRARTLEPKTALYYRSFEFADAKVAATKTLTAVLKDPNDVDDDAIRSAYQSASRQQANAYREMSLIVQAARQNGLSDSQIRAVLKSSSISDKDILFLLNRKIPPVQLSKQSLKNATKKALAIYDAETAAEIQRRYKLANQMGREEQK
jgi:hypothetical protein